MNNTLSTCLVLSAALLGIAIAQTADAQSEPVYIADSADCIIHSSQGWGELGLNTAVKPTDGRAAMKLRIKDTEYERGIGTHANGEMTIELLGQYKAFEAEIGVQWQDGKNGSVVFQVFVDDEKRFDSGVMTEFDAPKPISVPVQGAGYVRLVVTDAGDGITCDCPNWANARLIPDPAAPKGVQLPTADIAPFAAVATWDPARMKGTAANRVEEFPAGDVLLHRELTPNADGAFVVPAVDSGAGCIGLRWAETRFLRSLGLVFANGAVPATEGIKIQYWVGESPWQGEWKDLVADIEANDAQWNVVISLAKNADLRTGTQMIRWVFPNARTPVVISALSAHSGSPAETVALRIEMESAKAGQGHIEMYNGSAVGTQGGQPVRLLDWDTAQPLQLKVERFKSRPFKTDRTLLRFTLPDTQAFSVCVDDVLANDAVYVAHAGLYVTRDPAPVSLADYRARMTEQKTVLERVRTMPDQTFAQAMEKVHNPIQDLGPMLVSLACDNRKFVAHRDGAITFEVYDAPDQNVNWPDTYSCRFTPQFGAGETPDVQRHLHGGWLPAPVTTVKKDGLVYTQRTFVAPFDSEPVPDTNGWLCGKVLCVAEYTIENPLPAQAEASLGLALARKDHPLACTNRDGGFIIAEGERVLARVVADRSLAGLVAPDGTIALSTPLAPGASARCVVFFPAWNASPDDLAAMKDDARWMEGMEAYWNRVMQPVMQVAVPDELLMNVIRASQVHCLLAARNEGNGGRISPYISSDRYGPLESESNSVIRGMDLLGHEEFARRSFDFFIHRYNANGFLTTGYTIMGTGWHLWTLAEHFQRTRNAAWFRSVAPEVGRVCHWLVAQREKTKRVDARLKRLPEYGLVPPGVGADWNRYAYRFGCEGHYCNGLSEAARALGAVGYADADDLLANAEDYRKAILAGYAWTQARAPVQALQNGAWVPAYPGMLYCFGRIEDVIPGEDWGRSWAYDVELGAHHLALLGVLDPNSDEMGRMLEHMEDFWFLHSGMGDYPEEKNRADWFNLGGFAKIQPYYARNAELCALRDDVKPFIRSYFNTIPTLLSLENLSFWEHYHNTGGWNKTHETGYFLAQTRTMLVTERGEELWLAPFVTNNWLQDGMTVSVTDAPTKFGKVSYSITSRVNAGTIEATIQPPKRNPPARIVIRLRHPEGKRLQSVTMNAAPLATFDAEKETLTLPATPEKIVVKAVY